MMTDNLKIIILICKSLKDSIPTQCKNDRKRNKTVGLKVNYVSETTVTIEETKLRNNSTSNAAIVVELVDHPNDVENIDFEVEFKCLIIAYTEGADADSMLGQYMEVPRPTFLSIDSAHSDGMPVPLPPQPLHEESATPVDNGSTYIYDMFELDVVEKIIQADRQPRMPMPMRMT